MPSTIELQMLGLSVVLGLVHLVPKLANYTAAAWHGRRDRGTTLRRRCPS